MVRIAEKNDIEGVVDLLMEYRDFYGVKIQDRTEAVRFIMQRMENCESKIFVAMDGDNYVGFIQLYPSFSTVSLKRQWILNDLYVKEEYRNKGYGTALMTAVKNHFKESAKGFVLLTGKDNITAQKFYSGNGWESGIYDVYTFFYN